MHPALSRPFSEYGRRRRDMSDGHDDGRFKFLAESRARAEQTSDIHRELPNIRVSDAWTGKSAGAAGELRAWQVIDCRLGFRVPGQLKSRSSTADSSLDSESVGPGPGRWRTPRLGPPLRLGSGRLEPRRLLKRRPASPAAVESPATAPRQAGQRSRPAKPAGRRLYSGFGHGPLPRAQPPETAALQRSRRVGRG